MNFNLLFSVVSSLSFIIKFEVDSNERQDYFLFTGHNNTAHLYRENKTLLLHITQQHGKVLAIYNASLEDYNFTFSWSGFQINDRMMKKQRSLGQIGQLEFEHFTFISPVVDVADLQCSIESIIYDVGAVNYWYFLFMMLAVAIIFDSKTLAINTLKRLMKIQNRNDDYESEYVSMDNAFCPTKNENVNESNV